MFEKVRLTSFKCFPKVELPVRRLTLLTGVNGGGKSSILQALILLAQTFELREWSRSLLLEGPEIAIGNAADVLYQQSDTKSLSLGCTVHGESVDWTFSAADRYALSLELTSVQFNGQKALLGETLRWLMPPNQADASKVVRAIRSLTWVSAERFGPREVLPLRDKEAQVKVGSRGEFAAGLLYWYWNDDRPVLPELCLPGYDSLLPNQTRARMQAFFPGCDFHQLNRQSERGDLAA